MIRFQSWSLSPNLTIPRGFAPASYPVIAPINRGGLLASISVKGNLHVIRKFGMCVSPRWLTIRAAGCWKILHNNIHVYLCFWRVLSNAQLIANRSARLWQRYLREPEKWILNECEDDVRTRGDIQSFKQNKNKIETKSARGLVNYRKRTVGQFQNNIYDISMADSIVTTPGP